MDNFLNQVFFFLCLVDVSRYIPWHTKRRNLRIRVCGFGKSEKRFLGTQRISYEEPTRTFEIQEPASGRTVVSVPPWIRGSLHRCGRQPGNDVCRIRHPWWTSWDSPRACWKNQTYVRVSVGVDIVSALGSLLRLQCVDLVHCSLGQWNTGWSQTHRSSVHHLSWLVFHLLGKSVLRRRLWQHRLSLGCLVWYRDALPS